MEPRYNEPVTNEVIGFTVISVTAKHMKKNPVIGNKFPHSLGPSLYRGYNFIDKSNKKRLFMTQSLSNRYYSIPLFQNYALKQTGTISKTFCIEVLQVLLIQ